MTPIRLALVSEVSEVRLKEVERVASAIQRQIDEEFGEIWGIDGASIRACESTESVDGAWPVILGDPRKFDFPSQGLHFTHDDTPFALIKYTQDWSVAVSHEVLEMCTDPTGDRVMVAPAINDDHRLVEYLLEVCDPCEATQFAYKKNGTLVSDFYTPRYFDAEFQRGVRYSFNGSIQRPRQVLPGGYLSWWDSYTDEHWQLRLFGSKQELTRVEGFDGTGLESRRTEVDRITPRPLAGPPPPAEVGDRSRPIPPDNKFSQRLRELARASPNSRP